VHPSPEGQTKKENKIKRKTTTKEKAGEREKVGSAQIHPNLLAKPCRRNKQTRNQGMREKEHIGSVARGLGAGAPRVFLLFEPPGFVVSSVRPRYYPLLPVLA
jgi:hypothetical protein